MAPVSFRRDIRLLGYFDHGPYLYRPLQRTRNCHADAVSLRHEKARQARQTSEMIQSSAAGGEGSMDSQVGTFVSPVEYVVHTVDRKITTTSMTAAIFGLAVVVFSNCTIVEVIVVVAGAGLCSRKVRIDGLVVHARPDSDALLTSRLDWKSKGKSSRSQIGSACFGIVSLSSGGHLLRDRRCELWQQQHSPAMSNIPVQ